MLQSFLHLQKYRRFTSIITHKKVTYIKSSTPMNALSSTIRTDGGKVIFVIPEMKAKAQEQIFSILEFEENESDFNFLQ